MKDAGGAVAAYQEAAQLNREDSLRRGSLLVFPDYGQVVMTGDLHGYRRNFEKLQRYCDLQHFGARHVILHEIIHEEPERLLEPDMSHEVLLEAARWKCAFPEQVHFLWGNHDLAQVNRQEISKNGRVVTRDFEEGIARTYGPAAPEVLVALYGFIRSFPIAGRTANRIFLSHSLPGPRELPTFDPAILDHNPEEVDYGENGSLHALVWGRYQDRYTIERLRELLDADFFLCGHQPQEMGYDVRHGCMVILASDHNHGVFLPVDLSKPVTIETLTHHIRPFAAVA